MNLNLLNSAQKLTLCHILFIAEELAEYVVGIFAEIKPITKTQNVFSLILYF